MKTLRLPIHNDPATHQADRDRICQQIQRCPCGVTVTIEKGVIRSPDQNAFYWGVIIPLILEFQGEYDCERDWLHEELCCRFLKVDDGVNEKGFPFTVVKPTSILTTAEFEKYLDEIRKFFASEYQLVLPLPNEAEPVETRTKIIEAKKKRLTELEAAEAEITRLNFELKTLKDNERVD